MWKLLYQLASPASFYEYMGRLVPWITGLMVICLSLGLVGGLAWAPTDFQQGEGYRIIYIHVPSAFCSLLVYGVMSFAAVLSLVWRIKVADIILQCSAPLGFSFTLLALATGSLWGKPMWGTWWIWDARLTSELILAFIYLGIIGLGSAITCPQVRAKSLAIMVLIGAIDLPIIHYSVVWWHSLHQGSTLKLVGQSSIDNRMLYPLLLMIIGFVCFYAQQVCLRARQHILRRDWHRAWVKDLKDVANIG